MNNPDALYFFEAFAAKEIAFGEEDLKTAIFEE